MRKLIIFLYFVFLFKLAFAQSLPTIPSFSDFSKVEPSAGGAEVAQVPDMPSLGNDDDLPSDLDLPTSDKKAENKDADPKVEVPGTTAEAPAASTTSDIDIEAPALDAPAQKDANAVPELPNEFEAPALPPTEGTGSTAPLPQAEVKDLPTLPTQPTDTAKTTDTVTPAATTAAAPAAEKAPELPAVPSVGLGANEAPSVEDAKEATKNDSPAKAATADGSVMDQINSEDAERNEFPETPDLNYEKNKKAAQAPAEPAAPAQTSAEREKEVDNLLNQVFDKGKTPEQIAQEKAQQAADEEAANKEKNSKQDDSPLMEKVVDVNEQPVQSLDELQTDDNEQFDLSDVPASMREGKTNSSPFVENKTRPVYTSNTYSEQQLSDMLVKASMKGDKNSVIQLIHSGRNPNAQNVYGETPLMGAVYNGHNNVVEILLSEGADANITDNKGNSSLLVASARNNLQAVQQLIRGGADIDQANNSSDTPLLVATLNNNLDVADTLIRQGANINKSNADGLTALHIAAYNGNSAMVKYLLSVGANPGIVARGGHKAQDLARDSESKQLIASYVENEQKAADAKRIAEELREKNMMANTQAKASDSQYAMFPSAYVEPAKQEPAQVPQSNWWAAKAEKAPAASAPQTTQVADMPVQPIEENVSQENVINVETPQQVPASIAFKNLMEKRGGYSAAPTANYAPAPVQSQAIQYQSPAPVAAPVQVANDKKWMKLTPDQSLNTSPVPAINVQQQQVNALPVQTISVQPASQANAPQFTTLAPAQTPAAPQTMVRAQYDASGNIINTAAPQMTPAQPVAMTPAPVYQAPVQAIQAPAQAPASMNYKAAAYNAAPAYQAPVAQAPVRANYSNLPPQAYVAPQQVAANSQQYILPQGPISNNININVPKYSDLEPAKQAVWDMKLAQWVKDGMTIAARPEGEKVYWMKQQQVLQAVYQEQFPAKVESVKRKINGAAFNLSPTSKVAAGITVKSRAVKAAEVPQPSFKTSSSETQYLSEYTASN